MTTNALTSLYFDTRKEKTDGTFPVKVRVTYNRKQKYYPTGIDLTLIEWEKMNGSKPGKELKATNEKLIFFQGKAKAVINDLKVFSFDLFEQRFFRKKVSNGILANLYNDNIEKLKSEGRISTAISYQYSLNSLREYQPKLTIEQINVDFLKGFERSMTANGKSLTTVGIYLRALRAIFNEAIDKGHYPRELYPFGKKRYIIPAKKGIKKALAITDVRKIIDYPTPPGSGMQRAKDFWVFSYLCNGINPKDIARLRNKDLDKTILHFTRAKTANTTKGDSREIVVPLLDETKQIIKRWRNTDKSADAYLFPILTPGMTPEKEYATIQQFVKTINTYMRKMADDLKIEKDVTTYTARHTFSTVLKKSGASIEFIQEALGHKDKSTTESYLDSFEQETKKKFAEKLLPFK